MKRFSALLVSAALAATLTACGGGGGGGGDDDVTGNITQTSYATQAEDLVDTLDAAGLASAAIGAGPAAAAAASVTDPANAGALAYRVIHALHTLVPRELRQAVQPFEEACPEGGSISGSINDADSSGGVSAGDVFTSTYNACVIDGETIDGGLHFTVRSYSFDGTVESSSLDFTFVQLGNDALRYDGGVRVSLTFDVNTLAETFAMAYRNMAVTMGGDACEWNFTATFRHTSHDVDTASFAGLIGIGGPTYRLAQTTPFVLTAEGTPSSGTLTVSDADGDRLEIAAGAVRYVYRLFLDGNDTSTPDAQVDGRFYEEDRAAL